MNNPNNVIEVQNVEKYFKVYYDRGITLKDKILSSNRSRYDKRKVLKGITFSVKKGEAIGLIGKNGCGKSTTLKLLSKIIYPNKGSIQMKGRVSSLLELGAGFHPDMSGRENIYMNAAVFGLSKKEIDKRVNSIIKFSELEEFIDNPIRTYSSGMYMRLAFSVAINVDADILLVDEILAVGDISFQKKCFERLKEIKRTGTTIVIVSHSLDQIEKICNRTIWIENGVIREEGTPHEVHQLYLQSMEQERLQRFQKEYYETVSESPACTPTESEQTAEQPTEAKNEEEYQGTDVEEISPSTIDMEIRDLKINFLSSQNTKITHTGNGTLRFEEMYITNSQGEEVVCFETGDSLNIYIKYKTIQSDLQGTLCLLFYSDDGTYCYGTNTYIETGKILDLNKTKFLKVAVANLPLLSGKYYITISCHNEQATVCEHIDYAATIQIFSPKGEQGITRIETEWCLE